MTGQCFSPVSFTNKTDRHDITEILLKVALSNIMPPPTNWKSLHINLILNHRTKQRGIDMIMGLKLGDF
jgi:hypothetical protein